MKYVLASILVYGLVSFSGSAFADNCPTARENTSALLEDLRAAVVNMAEGGNTVASIKRRIDSVRNSLVSIRVYCHGKSDYLIAANNIADHLDRLENKLEDKE